MRDAERSMRLSWLFTNADEGSAEPRRCRRTCGDGASATGRRRTLSVDGAVWFLFGELLVVFSALAAGRAEGPLTAHTAGTRSGPRRAEMYAALEPAGAGASPPVCSSSPPRVLYGLSMSGRRPLLCLSMSGGDV